MYFLGSVGRPPRQFSSAYIAQKQHYFSETAKYKNCDRIRRLRLRHFQRTEITAEPQLWLFSKKGHFAMMVIHHQITFYLQLGSLMLVLKLYALFTFLNMYSPTPDINTTHFPCTYNTNGRTGIMYYLIITQIRVVIINHLYIWRL